jgi:hypothetical protein
LTLFTSPYHSAFSADGMVLNTVTCTELVEVSRKKNGKIKILAQFGIFIRIIILNIGGKKANTQ